jgi:hypothetical protein
MRPAAGPLMLSREPENQETTKPPIPAVNKPIKGGKLLAFAIPKLKGMASKKTKNPLKKS